MISISTDFITSSINIADDVDFPNNEFISESVEEEVVNFEEWMMDSDSKRYGQGRIMFINGSDWTTTDAQLLAIHPEILETEEKSEEVEYEYQSTHPKNGIPTTLDANKNISISYESKMSFKS